MTTSETLDPLAYYSRPAMMTDPGPYAALLDSLPAGTAALCEVVQGLLLHVFWAERYGVELSEARRQEVNLRAVSDMIARIISLDDKPVATARCPERKLVGNCRDFSVLLCAFLRYQGVPARARCGFGAYFRPGRHEDHWLCECWDPEQGRWVMVDAQLDALQCQVLGIQFDPHDVPHDQFLVGGKAWQICRTGQADPDTFGIFDMHGLWFIRGNLVRDFLALNKIEILPWDAWGEIITSQEQLPCKETAFFDRLAALTLAGDVAFPEIRKLCERDARLRMPRGWPPGQA
jgi:hypothetical protein